MCSVCGCGPGEARIEAPKGAVAHAHHHAHEHGQHDHDHRHGQDADHEHMPDGSVRMLFPKTLISVEQDILSRNNSHAARNRALFASAGILALNLVSSPGAGKTTLLVETLKRLKGRIALGVVEGDQETSNDADRIRATGVPAVQVNTGKGCHLDAPMVERALDQMALPMHGLLFIENVGNLVCPAAFDLGEAHKVVMCS